MKMVDPIKFFNRLEWLDGSPLLDVIEPYRQRIFSEALYSFDGDRPRYNLVLTGRAKKNWKSADLVLAALYRLLVWESPLGNQCFILANDEGQAADDLTLAKKLIKVNPVLKREVKVKTNVIERIDGEGFLEILPAGDVAGTHGKTFLYCGFDEIHEYRGWDLLEAMQLDPHRPDAMTWITSYNSLYSYKGAPLFDLIQQGKADQDPRMYFSWYGADYCTDPEYALKEMPEDRANPSNLPEGYLEQQKRRLPTHKFRRLHLNMPGSPEGAYFAPEKVEGAVGDYKILSPQPKQFHRAFVDMSGGSGDDATLSIAYHDGERVKVCGVWNQGQRPPFDPRKAVSLFSTICKSYGVAHVIMDRYAGETFRQDFASHGISAEVCPVPKSSLYEAMEIELNTDRVSLPDDALLIKQLLTLVMKGGKIDHPSGEHDDLANVVAGVTYYSKSGTQPFFIDFPGEPLQSLRLDGPWDYREYEDLPTQW